MSETFEEFWCTEKNSPRSSDIHTWSKFTWNHQQKKIDVLTNDLKKTIDRNKRLQAEVDRFKTLIGQDNLPHWYAIEERNKSLTSLLEKAEKKIDVITDKWNHLDKLTTIQHGKIDAKDARIKELEGELSKRYDLNLISEYQGRIESLTSQLKKLTRCEYGDSCLNVNNKCQGCKNKMFLELKNPETEI